MKRAAYVGLVVGTIPLFGCGAYLLSLLSVAGGCNLPVVLPGVTVTVTSAETGEPVTGAVLTLSGGDDGETATGAYASFLADWADRGPYTLTVQADGFATQTIDNIVVNRVGCNVDTVNLTVELVPTN